jgi:hypothetical protein
MKLSVLTAIVACLSVYNRAVALASSGCEDAFARCNVDGEVCLAENGKESWGWSSPLFGVGRSMDCELWVRAQKCDSTTKESKMIGSVTVDSTTHAITVRIADPDYVMFGANAYLGATITPLDKGEITATRFSQPVREAVIEATSADGQAYLITHVRVCPKDLVLLEDDEEATHRQLTFFWDWWFPKHPTPVYFPPPTPAPVFVHPSPNFNWWCWLLKKCDSGPSPTAKQTIRPTKKPTHKPVSRPSPRPSKAPTKRPSRLPTIRPSSRPSPRPARPSRKPSKRPTRIPSRKPSKKPSSRPSRRPSKKPVAAPTKAPVQPTNPPVPNVDTDAPTPFASPAPTPPPTISPTPDPFDVPT